MVGDATEPQGRGGLLAFCHGGATTSTTRGLLYYSYAGSNAQNKSLSLATAAAPAIQKPSSSPSPLHSAASPLHSPAPPPNAGAAALPPPVLPHSLATALIALRLLPSLPLLEPRSNRRRRSAPSFSPHLLRCLYNE